MGSEEGGYSGLALGFFFQSPCIHAAHACVTKQLSSEAQQSAALKKVDKIRQAQEDNVQRLRDKEAEDRLRAQLIEESIGEIDQLLALLRASVEQGRHGAACTASTAFCPSTSPPPLVTPSGTGRSSSG